MLKWTYFFILGLLGPRYAFWKLRQSSKNPQTYGEKVRHKIAFDRDPLLTTMADKIAVRNLVGEIVGPEYLIRAHAATSE